MRIYSLLLLGPMALLHAQPPSRTLDGYIVDSVTGAPVASARVKLGTMYSSADAAGHFRFDNLSAAKYAFP
jgi:hypothetical protein